MSPPTPTASLLWAVARPGLDPGAVRAAMVLGPDLGLAADLAIEQRLSPLLHRAISSLDDGWGRLPPARAAAVAADAARCRAQAALLLPVLARLGLQPLVAAGLEPVVLKGAALASRYPDAGLRPMDDVDVYVPPSDHPEALRVLRRSGWQLRARPGRHHEVVLSHPEVPGLPLELHRAFATWPTRSSRLSLRALWLDRTPRTVGGVSCFGFSPVDEVLALATHAAKPFHTFDRLIWITDLAVVVSAAEREGRPLDWDALAAGAARARCTSALAVALVQAARLGIASPSVLRRPTASSARLAALTPVLSPDWPVLERDEGTRNRLRYALVDDPRLRLALLGENVVGAGPAATPRKAATTGLRLVRRWRQLRRSAESGSEEAGRLVEP